MDRIIGWIETKSVNDTTIIISRESQLKRLKQFLASLRSSDPRTCLLLYGPLGVGKTTLVSRLPTMANDVSFPMLRFQMDGRNKFEDLSQFIGGLARGVESEWPELEPYVDAFGNYQPPSDGSDEVLLDDFIEKLDEYFFQSEQSENHPELAELQIVFVLEDAEQLEPTTIDYFRKLIAVFSKKDIYSNQYHFFFSGEDRGRSVENIQSIFKGDADVTEVLVPPFSQPETDAYLKQFGVAASMFVEVQKETGGLPSKLVEYCKNYQPEDPKESELIRSGENLVKKLTVEQEEWIKIAALLSVCDKESLGLFLSEDQRIRALEWLKFIPLSCVESDSSGIRIRKAESNALIALQKRESVSKLGKRLKKVQQFESVKKVIPKYEQRQILSVLAEFDFFDRAVLIHIFGEEQANLYLNLVETKTVFFSVSNSRMRLSRNAKIMMQLYNRLFPPKDQANLRAKVRGYSKRMEKDLRQEIEEEEKRIVSNETLREEIKNAIVGVDEHIQQTSQHLGKLEKDRKSMAVEVRRSRVGYLSILMQALGIVVLYIAVLYREDYMMPLLAAAGVLITIGFVFSLRKHGNMKVKRTNILRQSKRRDQTAKDLEKLKTEKLKLATRRDQTIKNVQESRQQIQSIELMLKQPYMR